MKNYYLQLRYIIKKYFIDDDDILSKSYKEIRANEVDYEAYLEASKRLEENLKDSNKENKATFTTQAGEQITLTY